MNAIHLIPVGKENKISRIELNHKLDESDREIRRELAKASLEIPVINVGDGYYVPDFHSTEDMLDAKRYSASLKSRAYSLLARARVIDGFIEVADGGNIYRSARKLANLTQKEVAEACGMTVPEISKIENGRTMPTAEQHKAIEKACGVKI